MVESPKKLSPATRWGLVIGLWAILSALLYLGVRNVAWVMTWAPGVLFYCLLLFGLVVACSLLAAAIHLSADTIRGRYPYHQDAPSPTLSGAPRTVQRSVGPAVPLLPAGPHKSRLRMGMEALAVLVVTMAMTFVLLEIGLRLFAPQYAPELSMDVNAGLWTPDPTTGYRNNPGAHISYHYDEINTTYDINQQGVREDHKVDAPAPGTVRLLSIGDSFAFGAGVAADQTYAHLLNGSQASDGSPVESINGGVGGYGTDNEIAWLDAYGWSLQPKIVLLGFFAGNDTHDNMLGIHKTYVDAQGRLIESPEILQQMNRPEDAPPAGPVASVKSWLAHHSQAYIFLRRLAHDAHDALFPPPRTVIKPNPFDTAPVYMKSESAAFTAGWETTFGILEKMRSDAEAHGAKLVVVVIPAREQVEDSYWDEMKARFGLTEDSLERDHPQRRLAGWSVRTGTPLIDLLPAFRAAPTDLLLYYHKDIHFTTAGQAFAAQQIRLGLVRLGIFR